MHSKIEKDDKRSKDPLLDRRSGDDRREAYDLDYIDQGSTERREPAERRTLGERRDRYVRVSRWSSVFPEKKESAG